MKSWKKRLNAEFDSATPPLDKTIENAPVPARADDVQRQGDVIAKRKLGFTAIAAGCMALLIALVFAISYIAGAFNKKPTVPDSLVFTLEINPAVSFITGGDGNVVSVNALNDDADVILSDDKILNELLNANVKTAAITFADYAAKLGYLNVSATKNAVRLSCSDETNENTITEITDGLRDYFKDKGIYAVVIENVVSASALGEIIGTENISTLAELSETVKNLSVRYGEREINGATADELKTLYEKTVLDDNFYERLKDELSLSMQKITDCATELTNFAALKISIYTHSDNPKGGLLNLKPLDYWEIKEKYADDYSTFTEDFANLMRQADEIVENYKTNFGVTLDNNLFDSITKALPETDLTSWLSPAPEDLKEKAETYITILKAVGIDTNAFESLLKVPATAQEYADKLKISLSQTFNEKSESNKAIYEEQRKVLTEEDYDKFVSNILSEYGSLENFWKNK